MPPSPLSRLRRLCLALPGAHEVEAWGEPTFRVRNKLFAMYASSHNHHGAGRPSVWCKAGPGNQELMIAADPDRYFRPPYVGPSGWVGIHLDRGVEWQMVRETVEDAYRLVAPKPRQRVPAAASVPLPSALGKPALRALEAAGIRSLADAARRGEVELGALHGVGPKALRILREALAAAGIARHASR